MKVTIKVIDNKNINCRIKNSDKTGFYLRGEVEKFPTINCVFIVPDYTQYPWKFNSLGRVTNIRESSENNIIEFETEKGIFSLQIFLELWTEGFRTNGEIGTASKLGEYPVKTLSEAIQAYIDEVQPYRRSDKVHLVRGVYSIWGCRIFDNEKQARESFG